MDQASPEAVALVRDLGSHAALKAREAVYDACQLVGDDGEMAFAIAVNVIASLMCGTAQMIGGEDSHAERITKLITVIADVMTTHADHGDDD